MSYILDALRRADAERERGAVPGIHAQPVVLGETDAETRGSSRRGKWVAAGLGVLLLLAMVVWFMLRGSDAPQPGGDANANANAGATRPANPMPVTPAAPVAAAPVVSPLVPPPQAVVAAPAAALVAPLVLPAEAPPAVRKPVPKVASAAAPKLATPANKPVAKAVAASAPASTPVAAELRLYLLGELPEDIRRELPALAIGGAMYSQNPANRLLIVNGQTFHEGDKLSPNLTLEQIKLKSAVLDYKGYRYGITY